MKRTIRGTLISLLAFGLFWGYALGRQNLLPPNEIKSLEKSGHLIPAGKDTWKTPKGLILKGRDPKGQTRLEHIMRHTRDMPRRKKHGVFSVSRAEVINLMDQTWLAVKSGRLRGKARGGNVAYTYRLRKEVGYLGGQEGARKGHPKLNAVRMVLREGTSEVITFFPF